MRGFPARVLLHGETSVSPGGAGKKSGRIDGEGGPGLAVAFHPDPAAEPFGQFLDQGQPDSRTQVAEIGVFSHLVESVEYRSSSSGGM